MRVCAAHGILDSIFLIKNQYQKPSDLRLLLSHGNPPLTFSFFRPIIFPSKWQRREPCGTAGTERALHGLEERLPDWTGPSTIPEPPTEAIRRLGRAPPVTAETKRHSSRCASRVEPRDAIIPPLTKTIRGGIFVCLKTAPHLQIGGNDHV